MHRKTWISFLINLIIPLAGMSTDIYLPSLPAIAHYFHTSRMSAQLTVTGFVLGMGFAQLIAGPISDAWGRKKIMLGSLALQAMSIMGILLAPCINVMIVCRLLQGMAAAFMIVPGRAIINDVFSAHEIKAQFNYLTISFALGPIVAPFLGGYLQSCCGWKTNFIFLLFYVVAAFFLLVFAYQETLKKTKKFSFSHLSHNYLQIIENRYFVLSAIFIGLAWSYVAAFNVAAPFLVQTVLGYGPIVYGHLALVIGFAWFLGNTANRFIINYRSERKTLIALSLNTATILVMLALSLKGLFSINTLLIPTSIIVFCNGIIFPIGIGETLVLFKEIAASANACLFSIIWIIFCLLTFIASLLKTHSLFPLAVTFLSINLLSIGFHYMSLRTAAVKKS